jgi:hypothetical protein
MRFGKVSFNDAMRVGDKFMTINGSTNEHHHGSIRHLGTRFHPETNGKNHPRFNSHAAGHIR